MGFFLVAIGIFSGVLEGFGLYVLVSLAEGVQDVGVKWNDFQVANFRVA